MHRHYNVPDEGYIISGALALIISHPYSIWRVPVLLVEHLALPFDIPIVYEGYH